MADKFNSPVFVVGLPRSGTSMVAGSLAACGAWVGQTVGPAKENPKGFFEHAKIREEIVKALLREMDCDPLGVKTLPDLDVVGAYDAGNLAKRIGRIIRSESYSKSRTWLYKDAKLTLLWPVFAKAFPNARWIIVRRGKEGFIDSCLRASFMKQHTTDPKFWSELYDEYTARLKLLKDEQEKVYVISAKDIASGDFSKFEKLCRVIGLPFSEDKVRDFVSVDMFSNK